MKTKNRWAPPGWPWELELLAFIFVLIAIVVPLYLEQMQAPEPQQQLSLIAKAQMEKQQDVFTWAKLQGFFWALTIVGLYIGHLLIAGASIDFISTPFTHLFSPIVFAMITYYRLYQISISSNAATSIVSGNPLEIVLWILGVLIITFMVARIRMARHMLNFRSIDWEMSTPTQFDGTYFELLAHFQPLVYPPRMYRACKDGILIEGWFYVMPLPFDIIQSVDATRGASVTSAGYYLASSSKAMLRIRILDKTEPVLISPRDRTGFLHYCEQHISSFKPITHGGETGAQRSGTAGAAAVKH